MIAKAKRIYLIVLLTLTGLATCLAVGAVMLGDRRRGMEMAVESAVSVGYLLLLAFAAYTALDHRWWRVPAIAGAALAGILMVLMPLLVAAETTRTYSVWYELVDRLMGTSLTTVGLLCLLPWVMIPRLKAPGNLVQGATAGVMLLLWSFFQVTLWFDRALRGADETFFMLFFSLFILCGAGMLTVFVLNRFFGIKMPNPLSSVRATVWLKCPRCLKEQEIAAGAETRCASCKLKIKVEVEEPLCPKCGYNLHQLTRPVCPECGTALSPEEIAAHSHDPLIAWAKANDQRQ